LKLLSNQAERIEEIFGFGLNSEVTDLQLKSTGLSTLLGNDKSNLLFIPPHEPDAMFFHWA